MRIRRRARFVFLVTSLVASAVAVGARQTDRARAVYAQIDRIFTEQAYEAPRFGPARWLPDGTAYAIVEHATESKGSEIVRYDAATGARTVLVPASRLTPSIEARSPELRSRDAAAGLDVEDYDWSQDGRKLLIFTNTRRCGATTPGGTTGCWTWRPDVCNRSARTRRRPR